MDRTQLYQFTEPREILAQIFQEKRGHNPNFSLRAWSRSLGFRNPSYLSDVMRGKIRLKPKLAIKIAKTLGISEDEQRYFEALVYHHNASDETEKEFFAATMRKYRPEILFEEVDESSFFTWAKSWLYFIADEVPALKDFKEDYGYLARRIGEDVTPQMMERALKDLEAQGILQRDAKGRLKKKQAFNVQPHDSREKLRLIYEKCGKKFTEKGVLARFEQPINETYFGFDPCPIRRSDIPKIIDWLRDTLRECRKFEAKPESGEDIFLFELSFFNLTPGNPVGAGGIEPPTPAV